MPDTAKFDQSLPKYIFAGDRGETRHLSEDRRNNNAHSIVTVSMYSTKKIDSKADTRSPSTTRSENSSAVFTAQVAILRDEWQDMIGFSVQYLESDAADAQAVYVDEQKMLLGGRNAEGKNQERAMRFFHFSNWINIPGRIVVSDDQRIRRKVEGGEKSFVSGFTFIADKPLSDANYLGLRMVEGMFMPEGEGYLIAKGEDIVIEQFDTAYYLITPNSESREITAIQDETWVFPIIYAFYIASGNNKFPEHKYREGLQGLAQWYQMTGVSVIDLIEHLWAEGPRRWMPLYHGLVRVINKLGLVNVEKSIYDFYEHHAEPSARIFAIRLLGALKSGVAVQYLGQTIRPQLAMDDPVVEEVDRQLEGIVVLRRNQMNGYAPIVGLTRIADDVMSSIKGWLQLGDLFVPHWVKDYTHLATNMLIPDQKQYDLGDARVLDSDGTRFEQEFAIEGHSFRTRFIPDFDSRTITIDLLENSPGERPVHHRFGYLQLTYADNGEWHVTAMQLIRLDHIFVNTLKYVLLVMAFRYVQFLQTLSDSQKLSIFIDPAVTTFNPSPFDIVTFRRFGIIPETGDLQERFDFKAACVELDGGRMMNLRYIEVPAKDPSRTPLIIFIEGPEQHSVIIEPAVYDEAVRVVEVGEDTERQLIIDLLNNTPVEVIYGEEEVLDQIRYKARTAANSILIPLTGAQTPHNFTIQSVLISGVSYALKVEYAFRQTLASEPAINFEGLNREQLSALGQTMDA